MILIEDLGDETRDPPSAPIIRLSTEVDLKDKDLFRFLSDKEAILILLLCLPDEVYQNVDAAKSANGVWEKGTRQALLPA
ncbi:hypothetical protein Tco_1137467 [Tanacetum coccineum]